MPSRKRQQGRARRKASKTTVGLPLMVTTQVPKSQKCNHGLTPVIPQGGDMHRWYQIFFDEWQNENFLQSALAGLVLTHQKVPSVWADDDARETLREMLVKAGTNIILGVYGGPNECMEAGGAVAMAIFMLENYNQGRVDNFFCLRNHDTFHGDERRLVKFFAGRLNNQCGCLDEWFKAVKNKSVSGICCNCKARKEVTQHFVCSRCKRYQYCSKECQAEDWERHKRFCTRLKMQQFCFAVEARGLK